MSDLRGRVYQPEAGDPADAVWDAGDLGCGELVLELRWRVEALERGQRLRLVAHDAGARADIPSWCRLTGHTLVSAEHPVYWIRKES